MIKKALVRSLSHLIWRGHDRTTKSSRSFASNNSLVGNIKSSSSLWLLGDGNRWVKFITISNQHSFGGTRGKGGVKPSL